MARTLLVRARDPRRAAPVTSSPVSRTLFSAVCADMGVEAPLRAQTVHGRAADEGHEASSGPRAGPRRLAEPLVHGGADPRLGRGDHHEDVDAPAAGGPQPLLEVAGPCAVATARI